MTFEKVKETIVDSLNCEAEKVTMEANLKDDLQADSLDATELVMALEEAFDMSIDDEEMLKFHTVGDIVRYIDSHQ